MLKVWARRSNFTSLITGSLFISRSIGYNSDMQESPTKRQKLQKSALDQLKAFSQIVADTGNFSQIKEFSPEDSTTNPTLILQAAEKPEFEGLIKDAIESSIKNYGKYVEGEGKGRRKKEATLNSPFKFQTLQDKQKEELLDLICDKLSVNFGVQILKLIPGLVSTEVSARYSFDREETIARAERLIALYEEAGVKKERVLIKIAATWEGIKAAEYLRRKKIECNLTLIFNFYQAVACAQAGVYLISPFVGRILDWYKKNHPDTDFSKEDPGVRSVKAIYDYFKKHNHSTIVMGASFRNIEEITELAGCDKLTVSPALLDQLAKNFHLPVAKKLCKEHAQSSKLDQVKVDERLFRWEMNQDAMATEKLSEGIRNFSKDLNKLKDILIRRLCAL